MELIRRESDYALRAMVVLASGATGGTRSARRIAQGGGIPEEHLRKLMQRLARAGLVVSHMGKEGGFRLAREPGRISVLDVVQAVQGALAVNKCFNGGFSCPRRRQCGMRRGLSRINEGMTELFGKLSLRDLASGQERASTEVQT